MKLRLLIRQAWIEEVDWYDQLPVRVEESFRAALNEISALNTVELPRWIETSREDKIQIVVYCDASKDGYGKVKNSRVIRDGKASVHLITVAKLA